MILPAQIEEKGLFLRSHPRIRKQAWMQDFERDGALRILSSAKHANFLAHHSKLSNRGGTNDFFVGRYVGMGQGVALGWD